MKIPNDDFCCAPFVQMTLLADGKISPCCWKQDYVIGTARGTLEEAWNGEKLQALRQEFLSNNPKTCASKIKHTQCHKYFTRFRSSVVLNPVQSLPPKRLDLRLNGECNLSCVMCNTWKAPNGLYNDSFLWTDGPIFFSKLLEIDVLGGEPLIQADTFRLIDEVLKVNPTCRWRFVTNANFQFSSRLKGYLDRIEISGIGISHDAVTSDVYSKIRLKGNFERLRETSLAFIEYRNARRKMDRGFELSFYFCAQRDNWEQIPEFLQYCKTHAVKPVFQHIYSDPGQTSLANFQKPERDKLIQQLKSQIDKSSWPLLHSIFSPLQDLNLT